LPRLVEDYSASIGMRYSTVYVFVMLISSSCRGVRVVGSVALHGFHPFDPDKNNTTRS